MSAARLTLFLGLLTTQVFAQRDSLQSTLNEVVVSGSLYTASKSSSPVNIDVLHKAFFVRQKVPSFFEALQFVNGLRPQVNCGVCSTGDIHINGMEGAYTLVLIDGSPIVSGLATVYGLMGVPTSLIERVEVVKGPASTLFGSEAIAGVIHIITKQPNAAPKMAVDLVQTSHGEQTLDLGFKTKYGPRSSGLWGIHRYQSRIKIDHNGDGFTDLPIQDRISIMHRGSVTLANSAKLGYYGRVFHEQRWGGQLHFEPKYKGLDSAYGEHITTDRVELSGSLTRVGPKNPRFIWSWTSHKQQSYYGITPYFATQHIGFAQPTWQYHVRRVNYLGGLALRATYYNDNSPATADPRLWWAIIPGAFGQLEQQLNEHWSHLIGLRLDGTKAHGLVWTPRYNLLFRTTQKTHEFRVGGGRGFRVANVFTEDHAALSGARTVVFAESLRPETSWNAHATWTARTKQRSYSVLWELGAFYTYFINQIIPDYLSNPTEIRYANLKGFALNRGASASSTLVHTCGLSVSVGGTLIFNEVVDPSGMRSRPVLSERFQGVWDVSYQKKRIMIAYSGNLLSPMKLPLLGPSDPRDPNSPWFSVQNASIRYSFTHFGVGFHGYNLLNSRPSADRIARAHDPFNRNVLFDNLGNVVPSAENPNALVFDPSSVFASFQGCRWGLSINWLLD